MAQWLPLPGYKEYEVSERGELRGANTKHVLNKKHQTAIWRKILEASGSSASTCANVYTTVPRRAAASEQLTGTKTAPCALARRHPRAI